jgi:hypothetical protein
MIMIKFLIQHNNPLVFQERKIVEPAQLIANHTIQSGIIELILAYIHKIHTYEVQNNLHRFTLFLCDYADSFLQEFK